MVNKPADPLAGKMKLQDKFMQHNKLMKESTNSLVIPENKQQAIHLMEQCRSGNLSPGIGSRKIEGTADLYELRAGSGTRIAYRRNGDTIEIWGIFDKKNQDRILPILQKLRPVK